MAFDRRLLQFCASVYNITHSNKLVMTNMKTLLTASALLLSTAAANAQITVGVKGGISIPNLTAGGNETPLNTGYSSRQGPDFAGYVNFHIKGKFSIQPEVEYSSQGGKKDGFQALPTPASYQAQASAYGITLPPYLYANYSSEAKLNYLMIPVLARFDFPLGKKFAFYVDAGPFLGINLADKQVTSGNSYIWETNDQSTAPFPTPKQSFDTTDNIKSSINTINFGIEGNVGFSYRFSNFKVFVEGGGNYGFLNIQKYAADGENHTGAATARVGISYTFMKAKKETK